MIHNTVGAADFLINLAVAFLLGSAIGVERQLRQRTAGLRTNALVATGSALFVLIATSIPSNGDLSRIVSQIVTGVGFLGAGVIMKDGLSIRGLNTAATLWCSAAVGSMAGFGLLWEAAVGAFGVLSVHLLLQPAAKLINRKFSLMIEQNVHFQVHGVCSKETEVTLRQIVQTEISACGFIPAGLRSVNNTVNGIRLVDVVADFEGTMKQQKALESVVAKMTHQAGVVSAEWRITSTFEEKT
jgi:putative Mg2+ transporter-C (MgtC) family protein